MLINGCENYEKLPLIRLKITAAMNRSSALFADIVIRNANRQCSS